MTIDFRCPSDNTHAENSQKLSSSRIESKMFVSFILQTRNMAYQPCQTKVNRFLQKEVLLFRRAFHDDVICYKVHQAQAKLVQSSLYCRLLAFSQRGCWWIFVGCLSDLVGASNKEQRFNLLLGFSGGYREIN